MDAHFLSVAGWDEALDAHDRNLGLFRPRPRLRSRTGRPPVVVAFVDFITLIFRYC